jgi:AcrR family transcriptional regulator
MPRHFSEEDKERIKNELKETGKELFATLGLKKTTIADLTEAVGIAKGSFYQFFDSKEELYFIVLEEEAEKLRYKYKEEVINNSAPTKENLKQFLTIMLETIENNPLLNRVYNSDDLNLIQQKLDKEQLEEHKQLSLNAFLPIINHWQEEGDLIAEKPEVIIGVIRAIPLVSLHQEELGKNIYPEIMDLLIDLVAEGLVKS